jgi:hypothetical protein
MRILAVVGAVLALLLGFGLAGHHNPLPEPLPAGVTTGWPPAPDDHGCGIGIHFEDTFALTDAQLQAARDYVMDHCYGGHTPPPGTVYYWHH